jgi:hypothetical protein
MDELLVHIEGIGWWTAQATDWAAAAAQLRGEAAPAAPATKPAAALLPPNERRRAPEPVLLACEAAAQACAMSGRDAATLPCVFASIHGDLAITDAMCATLADDPLQLSPTRFHNSVHNAPAGYWTVATGCHAASSATSAWHASFGAGLFEAAVQALADATPVLFAAYDGRAPDPLGAVVGTAPAYANAFVLGPARSARTLASLRLRHEAQPAPAADAAHDPLAALRPLFAALAQAGPSCMRLPAGRASALAIEVLP